MTTQGNESRVGRCYVSETILTSHFDLEMAPHGFLRARVWQHRVMADRYSETATAGKLDEEDSRSVASASHLTPSQGRGSLWREEVLRSACDGDGHTMRGHIWHAASRDVANL